MTKKMPLEQVERQVIQLPPIESRERNNLLKWAEVTDLCLLLRRAVLQATLADNEADRRLFKEIREMKEERWHTSPS